MPGLYKSAVLLVLALHLGFVLWVMFGAFLTRGRPVLTGLHLASLVWGILIELLPWTCPLTWLEETLRARAGYAPYHGSFLMHYLGLIVYPDVPWALVAFCGVFVCAMNLAIYGYRAWKAWGPNRADRDRSHA
jgi:hypothetical protein